MEPLNNQNNNMPNQPANLNPANSMPSNVSGAQLYPNNPYFTQPVYQPVKEPESAYTKSLKKQFPFFGIGSMLYALFYAFCLYRNASGITYPFFVAGTLLFFFLSMKRLGVPCKKDSLFYMISIVLLGISNCTTNSPQLLFLNKCGIFLLAFILMLHTVYQDKEWNLPKYISALFQTIGSCLCCLFRPFSDMVFYFDAQKQERKAKNNYFVSILIGIAITIPALFVITVLLASADAVFEAVLDRIFTSFDFFTLIRIMFLIITVFFCSYAVNAALCMKKVKEEVPDKRKFDPVIAIVVTASLSFVYLVFSMIQILYLFIGNMQLPEGYTYSGYAREGFFQLLTVCILNLLLVLFCLYRFRENTALKVILTIISGCTYIMILSSALRMLMYINRYNLTLLRILVLWALAVIFLLMTGVTVFIYCRKFPLFTYGMAIVTVFYIGLSFAHPDYRIAKYNLDPEHIEYLNEYDIDDSKYYLSTLSADAAPVILDADRNPYISSLEDMLEDNEHPDDYYDDYTYDTLWVRRYYDHIRALNNRMHLRNFNFSVYKAGTYLTGEKNN